MEQLSTYQLFFNGFALGLVSWFLGMGFSKVVNLYKTLTS